MDNSYLRTCLECGFGAYRCLRCSSREGREIWHHTPPALNDPMPPTDHEVRLEELQARVQPD
jgi:hypothetical protein